jgi:LPXTG-site transpeptidase (sortase) family protein
VRNLWCLEKKSILPLIISATGIVPQSLFKNLKILDLGNTLVVEIQKGILLYSCHIVRKVLNIDTEHNKIQQSQNTITYKISFLQEETGGFQEFPN